MLGTRPPPDTTSERKGHKLGVVSLHDLWQQPKVILVIVGLWYGFTVARLPPPPPFHFLSVYFFSVSFCPCLPGPLGLDNLPPTSPPSPLTA